MSAFTPMDADDSIVPVGATTSTNPPEKPAAPTTSPTMMDHDDEVIPVDQTQAPQFSTQDQVNDHLRKLMDDPKVTGQQIRDFYTSLGGKLSEHDSAVLDARDQFVKANHKAMAVGIAPTPGDASGAPGLTDNRPFSTQEGIAQGIQSVLGNVAGAAGWVGNKAGLTNNWGDDTRHYFDNLDAQQATQGTDTGRTIGKIVATAPLAFAAPEVEGAGALAMLGRGAVMAGDGAVQGALTTDSRTAGGVARDAAVGGVLGLGLGSAGRALSRLGSTPTAAAQAGRQVLDTADRLGVAPLPADVGGAITKTANAAGEAGLLSHGPIARASSDYLDSLQAVRDRAAQSVLPAGATPRPLESTALDVLHGVGGLGDYEARSAEAGGKLYDKAANLAGNTQIATPRTLQAVNALIDQAERTPGNTPGVDALRSLRDDLTPTPGSTSPQTIFDREFGGANPTVTPGNRAQFAIDNLRRLRTSFGDNFDVSQRAAKEAAKTLWGPLSDDIQAGLRAAGKDDAADAYAAADKHWADRQINLDEIVNPILGSRSHEQLARTIEGMSRNNSDLLGRALDVMAPDQAAHVKASIIGNLGKASPGTQNATNDAFSIAQFGTDWSKLSDGVKQHLLAGHEGQQLQDLASLAEAAKASGRYKNTSGTARSLHALDVLSGLGSAVASGAGGVVAGVKTAGASLAGEYALGKTLASPAVGRAIVKMGEVRPFAKTGSALAKLAQHTATTIQNQ